MKELAWLMGNKYFLFALWVCLATLVQIGLAGRVCPDYGVLEIELDMTGKPIYLCIDSDTQLQVPCG